MSHAIMDPYSKEPQPTRSHAIDRVLRRDAETEKDLYETLQALAADPLMVPHLQRLMLAAADDQDALRRAWSRFRKDHAAA